MVSISVMINIQDFLKCIKFGDWACSSGRHFYKGRELDLHEILEQSTSFSDDYVQCESIYHMSQLKLPEVVDIRILQGLKDRFYSLVEKHYLKNVKKYGKVIPKIFQADGEEYSNLILNHSSCGASMRAPVLGFINANDHTLFTLSAMTHLHPEAISGSFAIVYAVKKLKESDEFIEECIKGAEIGERTAKNFINSIEKNVKHESISEKIQDVITTENVYSSIKNIRKEGIETRFVVPSSILIAKKAINFNNPKDAISYVVRKSYEIGVDPDTICSISMGMLGSHYDQDIVDEVDSIWKKYPMKSGTF